MKKILLSILALVSASALAGVVPTSPSVTVGTLPDPSTLDASQFNKYDGSVYIRTSTGTADGVADGLWHYSIKAGKWVKSPVPTWGAIGGSIASQSDLQTLLNTKQNNLTLTTTGANASLVGATLNIPADVNPYTGKVLQTLVYSGSQITGAATAFTAPTAFTLPPFTPKSTNSTLLIEFDASYSITGRSTDEFKAELRYGSTVLFEKRQRFDGGGAGGGTRGSTILPISAVYTNTTTGAKTFNVLISRLAGDDAITVNNNRIAKITEIQN